MIRRLSKRQEKNWTFLKQSVLGKHRIFLTSLGVAGCVLLLRYAGWLQTLELVAFDQLVTLRPLEPVDERIVIVGIGETDLRQVGRWPISDQLLATLLKKLKTYQPRAIGLDLYRDFPVPPGNEDLLQVYKTFPNLIGIKKLPDQNGIGVLPPPLLNQHQQIGFNNFVFDADGRVRRSLLYWETEAQQFDQSFALALALRYLKEQKIEPQAAADQSGNVQLRQAIFPKFRKNDGAYVRADAGGYQILANFRGPLGSFRQVSMMDVLAGKISPDLFRDRIVLIGSTATSLKDFVYTPYSGGLIGNSEEMTGIELQANFISQILSAALEERPLLQTWWEPWEWLWILVWAWVGGSLSWKLRLPQRSILNFLLASTTLFLISYLSLLVGWWIPFVPPLMALTGSSIVMMSYLAYQKEELKRSKEFLQSVINTIPDPIFVKDQGYRWIVLNQAFCELIGLPLETLLNKSDDDFFRREEATTFRQQDQQVFAGKAGGESEEYFTDIWGNTHLIATRRSLHRDAAGNIFLVGVIRDITERKNREQELEKNAYYDVLTGLPNRKAFYERLEQTLAWAQNQQKLIALLFLDLDGFKRINDTLGHDAGDLLLKNVAQRLTNCLRGSDTVARLGGDEFTIILSGIKDEQDAIRVAEKILSALSQSFQLGQHTIQVTTSIGISLYPFNGEEMDVLIKSADVAMYQAKERGKNRYECALFVREVKG
ncbi:MAG: CHASE2 domain-containing protein [Scytolyngbya sp. HA4215-MV1]|jgi:diguanylate cyclase (GGDEF)-like protein/PAS domain S-box-containing protein|nr:CHASE2 domain-containing protein [Scytolyngbya sp. HA4215-MV1]